MGDIGEKFTERLERRSFISRISKAAFGGAIALGTLFGSSRAAFASGATCNCCTLVNAHKCTAATQANCRSYYTWNCGSTTTCGCMCYDCYSHRCGLATCSGPQCVAC
jgi:hypothetical protein